MTITYSDGSSKRAALLSHTETTMRVAIEGMDDAIELVQVHGRWISEDCEVVLVAFEWERPRSGVSEEDCICSRELAARLIRLLLTDSSEDVSVSIPAQWEDLATTARIM